MCNVVHWGDKAPGPDGYSSQFFKDNWEIMKDDVIDAITNFFSSGKLLKQVNTTTITLIPKCNRPKKFTDFRPIAYCNTIYKCVSKILCNRLKAVLPHIIDEAQCAFVENRDIIQNILLCQELTKGFKRKGGKPKCLIKIDLRKAYDSISWSFIEEMMAALQFPWKFIRWVMACVTTPSYSLMINGDLCGFFERRD